MAKNEVDVKRDDRNLSVGNMSSMMPEFDRMFDNMVDRFFGTRFNSLLGDWPDMNRRALTNIQENDNAYVLVAEVPGIPKDDIKINISGNLLTVHAEQNEESGSENSEQGYRRQYRSFHQSFTLPTNVDPDKIEASCENGVLEVMLPKTEQSQPKRIEIQSGKGSFLKKLIGKKDESQKDVKH